MNRATLLRRAAALVLAPSVAKLVPELPAAGNFVAPVWTAPEAGVYVAQYNYQQILRRSTGMKVEWLEDEIAPVYSQLRLDNLRAAEKRIWLGEPA